MRESWRALRLLVGTSVRTEPLRSAAALLEPLSRLSFPLYAVWLKLITDGVVEQDVTRIAIGIGGIAGVQAVMLVVSLIGNDMRITLSESVGFAFDREVARLVSTLPGLDHHERADYQDRLELLRQNRAELGTSLNAILNVLNSIVGAIGTLVLLAFLNPALLLLALFALPAIPVAKLQQRWQREGEERSAPASRLARHLRGLTTDRNAGMEFRVFGLHDEIRDRYRAAAYDAREPVMSAERKEVRVSVGRQVFFAIGYLSAIGFVLWRAVNGAATAGDVVAAVYICRQVAEMVVWPIFSVARLGTILRAGGRLLWLRDYADTAAARRSGAQAPPDRLQSGITFDRVSFTYPGTERVVLHEASFTIPAGSVIALVGENGAGKTTLVKLLTRMYEPTSGQILVDGDDLAGLAVEQWRERTAAAFQDFARLELVAQQAVALGDLPRLDDEPATVAALERAAAGDVARALPDGMSTQLGSSWSDGVDLSTGQWQKLALGRALMRENPLITFFDEPTASLDAPTEHALFERYIAAARDRAETGSITVLISHRFSTVRSADLIIVLDGGRVTETGSHEELMGSAGTYAELYTLQARSYT